MNETLDEKNTEPIVKDQVGIRCAHCRQWKLYPKSIANVFEAARAFRRAHFNKCEAVPTEIRSEFDRVRSRNGHMAGAYEYWVQSCLELGMVDRDGEDGGIVFASN